MAEGKCQCRSIMYQGKTQNAMNSCVCVCVYVLENMQLALHGQGIVFSICCISANTIKKKRSGDAAKPKPPIGIFCCHGNYDIGYSYLLFSLKNHQRSDRNASISSSKRHPNHGRRSNAISRTSRRSELRLCTLQS